MAMFWINLFLELYHLNLNIQLDRYINRPSTAHFRFVNIVFGNQKKNIKENRQCGQKLDLNPTCDYDSHEWQKFDLGRF